MTNKPLFVSLLVLATSLAVVSCASGEKADPSPTDSTDQSISDAGDLTNVETSEPDGTLDVPGDTSFQDLDQVADTQQLDTTQTDTQTVDTQVQDTPPNDTADVTQPSALGRQCGANQGTNCMPTSPTWPSCANAQCDGLECLLISDTFGSCTKQCNADADCGNAAANSVVGQSFKCVTDGTNSFCLPGSNNPCTSNSTCPSGEVCKLSYADTGATLAPSSVCQTATAGGAPAGGICNTNPAVGAIQVCANDVCLGSRCTSFCTSETCGSSVLSCAPDVDLGGGLVRGICLGRDCLSEDQCTAPGFACAPAVLKGTAPDEYIGGNCQFVAIDPSLAQLGDACTVDADCDTDWCLVQNGVGQCAALCSSDAACATNQVCAALVYTLPNNRDQAVNVCQPAAGSRTLCNGNNSCSVTGEVCRTFMIGSPSVADPFIFTGSVQTFCAQKLNPAGVDTGADCTTNDCANDYCVNGGSHPNAF